jgi:tRNA pseudouridine38-40 synthase
MRRAAADLVGSHDFAAFRSVGTDTHTTVRTVTRSVLLPVAPRLAAQAVPHIVPPADAADEASWLAYEIDGDGFLRHMVRTIVGTLVEVGRGWRPPDSLPALLRGGSRAQAGATAPARGLFLVRVDYD